MNKPKNYENTRASGEFTPIELGGHYLVIKQVEERTSKTGKQMAVVSFDTTDRDKQPHYFADQFRADIRPDKKWPANGVAYITVEDDQGNCTGKFKGLCSSVENSNPGFVVPFDSTFATALKNKLVGGVFREEIGVYNGKETHQHKLLRFCSNDSVPEVKIPKVYESEEYKSWVASGGVTTQPMDSDGFMNIPDDADDELPFA